MPAFSCCVVLHRDVRTVAIPEVHLLLFRYLKKEVCYRNFASGTLASATFLAGTFVTATSAFFEKCTGFRQGGFAHRPVLLDNMSPFFSRAYLYKLWLSMLNAVKHVGIDLPIGLRFI